MVDNNNFRSMFSDLTAIDADRLADFLESAAMKLRVHARSDRADEASHELHKAAIRKCRIEICDMIEDGEDEDIAIRYCMRKYQLRRDTVLANLAIEQKRRIQIRREDQKRQVKSLTEKGLSVREIEALTGLPKSTVHRLKKT